MAQTIKRVPLTTRFTLNTDGRAHPRENAFVAATVVFGLVSIVCAFFTGVHMLGAWTGVAGVVSGLSGQMISATTRERAVTIIALGVSAVGLFINMAHGGLY